MYRLNQIAALLAGSLLAFAPAAMGQDCKCKQDSSMNCSCKNCSCKDCNCKQDEAALANDAAELVSAALSQDRLQGAKAVAVIPNVNKAAFNSGGRWGKGLMTMRDAGGHWLPPVFIQITGGNFGLQAGSESTDMVMVFTDEDAIESLLKGKLTLNADSDGVLVGTSQGGAVIEVDDQSDARVYGAGISGEDILLSRRVQSNAAVAPFLSALELSPRVSANHPEIQN